LCFAGVLILPTALALALAAAIYAHSYVRARRHQAATPHRLIFTALVVIAMTILSSLVYHALGGQLETVGPGGALVLVFVAALYQALNLVLLVPAMYLAARPPSIRKVLPGGGDLAYESATLVLAVLTAVVALHAIWLAPLSLVVLAVWHRASLVTELQRTANTDAKTGLLNAGAWRQTAERQLNEAGQRAVALLLIDLDHFKRINDAYGHLAGDAALRAVADVLTAELRGYDAVGRYGGEEFIALLPGTSEAAAISIAHRLCTAISEVSVQEQRHVTASIGVSYTSGRRLELDELIDAADRAMYAAKAYGRDQVAVG
jgi:diguanylate cyclase (GGDEF)-like protein